MHNDHFEFTGVRLGPVEDLGFKVEFWQHLCCGLLSHSSQIQPQPISFLQELLPPSVTVPVRQVSDYLTERLQNKETG